MGAVSSTSRKRKDLANALLVVRAEVVVDQHEHLLGSERIVVAAQLLDVGDALGVEQRRRSTDRLGMRFPARLSGSSSIARRRLFSLSMWFCRSCMWSDRRKLAGSRRIATILAPGDSAAMPAAAARDHRYSEEASPTRWPDRAGANSDR